MNGLIVKKIYRSTLAIQFLTVMAAYAGTVVDGIIVGSCLGVPSLTAYGLVTPIISILMGVASIFESGVTVLCSKYIGMGDKERMNKVFNQALFFTAVLHRPDRSCIHLVGTNSIAPWGQELCCTGNG